MTQADYTPTPPHDETAEHALVALAALSEHYRDRVLAAINPDDCYTIAWRACLRASAEGHPVPREHARQAFSVDADPRLIPDYAARVRDCAVRRRVIWAVNEVAADACRVGRPFDSAQAIERVRRALGHAEERPAGIAL